MAGLRFVICFAAVFVQAGYTCPTYRNGQPIPYNNAPCRYNLPNPAYERSSYGGRFPIESIGSFTSSAPLSLSIRSENSFQGLVDVRGILPFKGAVAVEGLVPSAGVGVVSYRNGDSLAIAEVPVAVASPYYPGLAEYGTSVAYSPGVATYGPGVATYGPGVASYGPSVAEIGPGVAAYGPGLLGCGLKGCDGAYAY